MSVSRFALALAGALAAAPAFARDAAPELPSQDDVTYPAGMAHATSTSTPTPASAAECAPPLRAADESRDDAVALAAAEPVSCVPPAAEQPPASSRQRS